jgi:transposase-like protein
MAHLTVKIQDTTLIIRSQVFCGTFQNTDENQKALFIFLRLLSCPITGKPFFTYQELADAFGKKDRRNIHNYMQEFQQCEGDFLQYLSRKNTKKDAVFSLLEAQILAAPLLTIAQHYRAFRESHGQEGVCEQTFRNYVQEIPAMKILKRIRQLRFNHEARLDVRRYLQERLNLPRLSQVKQKEVVEVFPEVQTPTSTARRKRGEWLTTPSMEAKLLVVLLAVSGLSQEMLALLFGVGQTSIHNWMYLICHEDLEWEILGHIVRWSGQVSFDEKWIKIRGVWHFALCAVDSATDFPLLIELHPTLDHVSWTLFFTRFKALYGVPTLIQSDGSQPLAAARTVVFSGVRYQLCKFHKLRNLMKRLRHQLHDGKLLKRCVRLAKHMFSNRWVSSRKYAARTLQRLAGEEVTSYIDTHILSCWRHLTMSLTSNASERFNRKIEKCVSARYGIPSVESAQVFLRGLWLKELLLHGQKHMAASSELVAVDVSRMCQEHVTTDRILHFFQAYCPSLVEKLG